MIVKRILREGELLKQLSISRTTLKNLIKEDKFPAAVSLGKRAKGWLISDIQVWESHLRGGEYA